MSIQRIPIDKYDGPPHENDTDSVLWTFRFTLPNNEQLIASFLGPWNKAKQKACAFAREHRANEILVSIPRGLSRRRPPSNPNDGKNPLGYRWRQLPLWP